MRHKMKFSSYLLAFCAFCAVAFTQDEPKTYYLSDDSPSVTWSPTTTETVVVSAEEGYQIAVNITKCDLDGEAGSFVTIKDANDESDTTKGLIFSYVLYNNYSFLYNSNALKGELSGSGVFTAIFTRLGEAVSTEEPTTEIILPTPSINDSTTLTVYLYGSAPAEFENGSALEQEFRSAVAAMAAEYCETENIYLNQSITIDNVIFDDVDQCPLSWQEHLCSRIIFRVPVSVDPDAPSEWPGYQLNSEHLRIMFDRLFDKYITPLGLRQESGPDLDSMFAWRVGVFSVVLVACVVALLVVKALVARFSTTRNHGSFSDTKSIVSKDRHSQTSMDPHYLQETPPLFESSFSMYNPERDSAIYTDSNYSNYAEYGTVGTNGIQGNIIAQIDEAGEIQGETDT